MEGIGDTTERAVHYRHPTHDTATQHVRGTWQLVTIRVAPVYHRQNHRTYVPES